MPDDVDDASAWAERSPEASLITIGEKSPRLAHTAFVAAGARLIGNVEVGPEASIWYNCVLRGDLNRIQVGPRTNIQDGTVIHCDGPSAGHPAGYPALIGADVLVGHMAMIHGAVLHDRAFVGMGAIVMDGCEIEGDAMLAAGAMLTPGKRIRSGQLWAGRPAKYLRDLTDSDIAGMHAGIIQYLDLAIRHRLGCRSRLPEDGTHHGPLPPECRRRAAQSRGSAEGRSFRNGDCQP